VQVGHPPLRVSSVPTALQAEPIAAWQGLQRAATVGMASIILETDAAPGTCAIYGRFGPES
jgi:hypothetical protein